MNKEKPPYSEIDHCHCWNQGNKPACGQGITHAVCCLCGLINPDFIAKKDLEEAMVKKKPNPLAESVEHLTNIGYNIALQDLKDKLIK